MMISGDFNIVYDYGYIFTSKKAMEQFISIPIVIKRNNMIHAYHWFQKSDQFRDIRYIIDDINNRYIYVDMKTMEYNSVGFTNITKDLLNIGFIKKHVFSILEFNRFYS